MRNLTAGELHCWYVEGKWPCCGCNEYLSGPSGGLAQNIQCPKCGTKMNVTDPESGISFHVGQMLSEPQGYKPPAAPSPTPVGWKRMLADFKRLLLPGIENVTHKFRRHTT